MNTTTYYMAKAQFIRTHNAFGLDAAMWQLEQQDIKVSKGIVAAWSHEAR